MNSEATPEATANIAPESRGFRLEAQWLITMNSELDVLQNHTLVVKDSRVEDIMPWNDAQQMYAELPAIDKRSDIVMPGLINAHTHLAMNLLRGYADDKPLKTWLEKHIWPAEANHMGEEFVRDGTQLALAECLLNGVTTVNDMYMMADTAASVFQESGMRASIGMIILDFPTAWASSKEEYFEKALSLNASIAGSTRLTTTLAPHAPYTVCTESLEKVAQLSDELSLPVHIHVQETRAEVEQFVSSHGVRPLQHLDELGLLNNRLLAVHLTQVTASEMTALATAGAHVLHCPESNQKLASGICPIHDLDKAEVNIAVGTDGAASNNDLDLLGECRSAVFQAKSVSGDAAVMPAMRALKMITIDAARALGIAEHTGSLESGKSADCIVISPDICMLPVYDVASTVLFANASRCVTDVWVEGKALLSNRQLQTLDVKRIAEKAQSWKLRIEHSQQ